MLQLAERKIFAGPRLKRLRGQLALTQTRMAEELGVSVSYLNLIERNQRPITAQFLLKLAETYQLDLRGLTDDGADQLANELGEALGDALFRGLDVPRAEIADVSRNAPVLTQALLRLYAAWRNRAGSAVEGQGEDGRAGPASGAIEQIRDLIQERRNHFASLDEPAEAVAEALRLESGDLFSALRERLRARHGITVRLLPVDVLPDSLRRYDVHRRQLQLSELLDQSGRTFHAAYQLGLLEHRADIDAIIADTGMEDDATRRLLRINLANYFAAGVMMPYARFHAAAEQTGYDLMLLAQRFGASFEQVCHRLTTLQRPTMRGVPFFMVRVDGAGNVSKRFAAGRFHFSKFGGTCPLWNIHATFRAPGRILTQVVEMPDGTRYVSIARTVRQYFTPWGEPEPDFAVALGCELRYAHHLVYARGRDLDNPNPTPIGPNCALCERTACRQRSQPPQGRALIIDEKSRGPSPFRFDTD